MGPIGRVHARLMHSLGAEIAAVLEIDRAEAEEAASWVADLQGREPAPCWTTRQLLEQPLDAVVICTPPALHLQQILLAFDNQLPVFCEKPLLWRPGDTAESVAHGLRQMERHPHLALFVNTSNTVLADAVRHRFPPLDEVDRFYFAFHTRGPHRQVDIAADLLPHALSLLLHLFGERQIRGLRWRHTENTVCLTFGYGRIEVEFDFLEQADAEPALILQLDDHRFTRIQVGRGPTYRVFMRDDRSGDKVASRDPFAVYAGRFLAFCRQPRGAREDQFSIGSYNAKLMARCLDLVRGAD